MNNHSNHRIMFKLKTNASKALLCVHPRSSGIVEPRHRVELTILMRSNPPLSPESIKGVKVMVLTAPFGLRNVDLNDDLDVKALWPNVPPGSVSQWKLKCHLSLDEQEAWEDMKSVFIGGKIPPRGQGVEAAASGPDRSRMVRADPASGPFGGQAGPASSAEDEGSQQDTVSTFYVDVEPIVLSEKLASASSSSDKGTIIQALVIAIAVMVFTQIFFP